MSPSDRRPEEAIAAHYEEAVKWRRQLHRNPQPAWLEFYATGFVAEKLAEWGYDLLLGKDIIEADKRVVVPSLQTLEAEYGRALGSGIKEQFIAPARGGYTGVVGVLKGALPGPVVGFRFDIDSLEIIESGDPSHRPAAQGFVSQNPGYAHMCGHDVHTAMGLLLARHFAENRNTLRGTVKFVFQPNEENLGGAVAMVEKKVVDDLDFLFGGHVGVNMKHVGQIAMNVKSFMALSRFEVTYSGRAAHAALRPNDGKNALLGACAAVTNLYAISRHADGASRVNVGVMHAGTSWNIIPDRAYLRLETRGVTNQINEFMAGKAREVLEGAAKMYGLALEIKPAATALSAESSPELIELGTSITEKLPSTAQVIQEAHFNASEDVTVMMERVQSRGGKALFVLFGTPFGGGHHSTTFDVDERVILNGAEFLAAMQREVARKA
ncbi:MAG: amidohydrolase [Syntrophobacteraceae bacterium]